MLFSKSKTDFPLFIAVVALVVVVAVDDVTDGRDGSGCDNRMEDETSLNCLENKKVWKYNYS